MEFSKPALTVEEQVALLKQRGLHISNFEQANHYLKYITYYRLRAYWLPLEKIKTTTGLSTFKENITFQNIVDLYAFDRSLRLLVMDAIERIEIAVRGVWAYHMAIKYGAHGYLKPTIYKDKKRFTASCGLLKKEIEKSKETFIKHYNAKYDKPQLPPIWMISEIFSFGQLSQWIRNLKEPKDRNAVARIFLLDEKVFLSFMHHISHIRNICAHHGRLWNKDFVFKMRLPKYPIALNKSLNKEKIKKIYNTLCVIKFLLDTISPTSTWDLRLMKLINTLKFDIASMGFPMDWCSLPIWQKTISSP